MIQQSITEISHHFSQVIQTLETDREAIGVTKQGELCAIILPVDQFVPQQNFGEKLNHWLAQNQTSLSQDNPFETTRDTSSGRDFSW